MSEDEVDSGAPIQYEVGMSLDEKQREYWGLYTAENREKFFWLFLNSFVDKWQQKVLLAHICEINRNVSLLHCAVLRPQLCCH